MRAGTGISEQTALIRCMTAKHMMEALLKKELGTSTLKRFGGGGGGCINNGQGYLTDQGKIFVKVNSGKEARTMFDGEYASLAAILQTNTVQVPKPIKVIDNPSGGSMFAAEFVEMRGLSRHAGRLGEQLARMHLHNEEVGRKQAAKESSVHKGEGEGEQAQYVDKFGFHVTTCCGYIAQDNTWEDDWVTFYCRHKLQQQLDLVEKEYHDSEARTLWGKLEKRIPQLFEGIEVKPALMHGDLWGGNAAENDNGPVVFDAASFYGHHEFDLGIACMFGGFSSSFWTNYHKLIPKAPGFDQRNKLYQLFHYLNHWNHFGTGYRGQSLSIMRQLTR